MKVILLTSTFLLSLLFVSFNANPSKKESFKNDFTYVPSGTFEYNNKKISVYAFYMLKGEVTNKQYRNFLKDLKANKREKDYQLAVPDTTQWNSISALNKPMVNLYFNHPFYDNYPVVNVTKKGAELYCIWLTKQMRKKYPKQNFNDFRLPTKAEWVYAAKADHKNAPYPWGNASLTNSKGCYLANYKLTGDENIRRDENNNLVVVQPLVNDKTYNASYTVSVWSYLPNKFGLYNMSGNVAEMVANEDVVMGGSWNDPGFDIQVTSEKEFKSPNPTVGFRVITSFNQSK
jgi:formylglycine-generating enzyme required for sulfatase activity